MFEHAGVKLAGARGQVSRAAWVALVCAALASGCASTDVEHDMVGALDATLEGTSLGLVRDSATTKFRAQIVDDGVTCKLSVGVDAYRDADELRVDLELDATETAPLVIGQGATVAASDRTPEVNGVKPQVIVNRATLVIRTKDATYYSTGGSVTIDALPPSPAAPLTIRFADVALKSFERATTHVLRGSMRVTYIGRNQTAGNKASACGGLAVVPGGLVY